MKNAPYLTGAQSHKATISPQQQLVARINALGMERRQQTAAAYAQAPGREHEVDRLMLVDLGIIARTTELDALRAELGLPSPVVASAQEHGDLSRKLYTARDLGTASASAAGG